MDSLKCQTFAVSPAEPGDFLFLVKQAVLNGELDVQIDVASGALRSAFKK